jgi:hypothetical protein
VSDRKFAADAKISANFTGRKANSVTVAFRNHGVPGLDQALGYVTQGLIEPQFWKLHIARHSIFESNLRENLRNPNPVEPVIEPRHTSSDMIRPPIEPRVSVITFAPHTPWTSQVLDVTLFDVLKRHPRYELPFGDEKATANFLMTKWHDFKQIMGELNTWRAFQALGFEFEFDTTSEPYRL